MHVIEGRRSREIMLQVHGEYFWPQTQNHTFPQGSMVSFMGEQFPWLWFTWGRDRTLGPILEAGLVKLGREICALWLRTQIYLSFIITRGQKLIWGAKSPFINNFIESAFTEYEVSVHYGLGPGVTKRSTLKFPFPKCGDWALCTSKTKHSLCPDPAKCLLKAVAQFLNNQDT